MLGSVIVTLTHGHAEEDDAEDEVGMVRVTALTFNNTLVPARPEAHPHSEGPRRE